MKYQLPPPEKSTCHLPSGLINAIMVAQDSFCAQDVSVVGFMSGGMVIDTVSEGFCNYLYILEKTKHYQN